MQVEKQPFPGALLASDAQPAIGLRLLSGELEPSAWRLLVDGNDVTAEAKVDGFGIVYKHDEPLIEGDHRVEVWHDDMRWNWQFRTSTPPFISAVGIEPYSGRDLPIAERRPTIWASYGDTHSGINVSSVRIALNQKDVTESAQIGRDRLEFRPSWDLDDGSHVVFITLQDWAGNGTYRPFFFHVGELPSIYIDSLDEMYAYGSSPILRATFRSDQRDIDMGSIRLHFNGVDVTELATLAMFSPRAGEITFRPTEALTSGLYLSTLEVGTSDEFVSHKEFGFRIDELRSYRFEILSPLDGEVILAPDVAVRVRADLRLGDLDSRPDPLPSLVLINGEEAWVESENDDGSLVYVEEIELEPGVNRVHVRAIFQDGVEREDDMSIVYKIDM